MVCTIPTAKQFSPAFNSSSVKHDNKYFAYAGKTSVACSNKKIVCFPFNFSYFESVPVRPFAATPRGSANCAIASPNQWLFEIDKYAPCGNPAPVSSLL